MDFEYQRRERKLSSRRVIFASYFNICRNRVPRKSDFERWHGLAEHGPFPSRPGYNGWPGEKARATANLWAALRLFRDLRAEERCIALNKFMARPRLWSTRSSWRAPRRVFRIEILLPSQLSSLFCLRMEPCTVRFHESVDHGRIFSQFIFFSLKVLLARKYIEPNMR